MKQKPAFLMPVKLSGSERELRMFREAVDSIKRQTDPDWILIMVDDFSDVQSVYDVIDEMKADLKDKLHVLYSEKNNGAGATRNKGVEYAHKIGCPFIIFNDSDDLSDPRRLELVRKVFESDNSVNVVYTSFDVIDENGNSKPTGKKIFRSESFFSELGLKQFIGYLDAGADTLMPEPVEDRLIALAAIMFWRMMNAAITRPNVTRL